MLSYFWNKKIELSSNSINLLKIIAIFMMIIDHYAIMKIVDGSSIYYIFRDFGRFTFPILSFIMIYNFIYNTSNKKKYILRLFIFFIISTPFYWFSIDNMEFDKLNIFFDLFLSLSFIFIYEKIILFFKKNRKNTYYLIEIFSIFFLIFLFFFISFILYYFSSYFFLGFWLSVAYYFFIKSINSKKTLLIIKIFSLFLILLILFYLNYLPDNILYNYFTIFSFFIILIIQKIDIKIPRMNKWFFYLFYPLHMIFIKLFL